MIADRNSGNTSPLAWVGSFPVYASTVLAAAHAATLVLTAVAMAVGAEALIQAFQFSSRAVAGDYRLWQLATYAFVHVPNPWLLLELYLLVVFGREIETFLGRRAFLQLYTALLLLPPIVLSLAGLAGFSSLLAGSSAVHFGVFIAFAALHPSAEVFSGIQSRWVALALLGISALQCLAFGRMADLCALLLDSAAAVVFVKIAVGSWSVALPKKRSRLRVLRREGGIVRAAPAPSIDAILEKISKSGMGSLTAKERSQLEKARADLIAKDRAN